MIIGTMLVAAALALLIYDSWDSWRAGNSAAEIQEKLDEAKNAAGSSSSDTNNLTDVNDSAEAEMLSIEMATVEIDGYAYIGTLSISRFGLELPVMAEWSYAGLKIAPGRYSGSVWTDDLVLCGHNYERHFGSLKELNAGDTISFTDVDGNVFN
ncbi:MAG: sortase, partial [Lachnospiraceae bacterium]|nr:sortase [Lachnospiraceae bacterium]